MKTSPEWILATQVGALVRGTSPAIQRPWT